MINCAKSVVKIAMIVAIVGEKRMKNQIKRLHQSKKV
jgi:hypothetical protein